MITATASWHYYTETLSLESAGVMALNHGECAGQQLKVIEDGVPIPAHCYVDFSGVSKPLDSARFSDRSTRRAPCWIC